MSLFTGQTKRVFAIGPASITGSECANGSLVDGQLVRAVKELVTSIGGGLRLDQPFNDLGIIQVGSLRVSRCRECLTALLSRCAAHLGRDYSPVAFREMFRRVRDSAVF